MTAHDPGCYILDADNRPVKVDVMTWGRWFENNRRRIGYTEITSEIRVSTVFLGIDHRFDGDGPPVLFETMIFGGPLNDEQWRYSSYDDAEAGHAMAVKKARAAIGPEGEAMTDLVERLQAAMDGESEVHSFDAMSDAKAEIERLRANADSLWQDVQSADEANKELCADNARLRTLVKELADELDGYSRGFRVASLRHYQPDLDVVQRARALVQKP